MPAPSKTHARGQTAHPELPFLTPCNGLAGLLKSLIIPGSNMGHLHFIVPSSLYFGKIHVPSINVALLSPKKTGVGLKKRLKKRIANLWSRKRAGRKSRKRPTPVVGMKSNGKCQITQKNYLDFSLIIIFTTAAVFRDCEHSAKKKHKPACSSESTN
jgi:hypothetical protein